MFLYICYCNRYMISTFTGGGKAKKTHSHAKNSSQLPANRPVEHKSDSGNWKIKSIGLGLIVYTYNPGAWKAEAEGKFKVSQGYVVRSYLKRKKKKVHLWLFHFISSHFNCQINLNKKHIRLVLEVLRSPLY